MLSPNLLLKLAAVGLVPVGLSYGLAPVPLLDQMLGIDASPTNLTHIFRAIMGLYLTMAAFWWMGSTRDTLQRPALYSLLLFMGGLAAGRVLSLVLDGVPGPSLLAATVLEILFAYAAFRALKS